MIAFGNCRLHDGGAGAMDIHKAPALSDDLPRVDTGQMEM